MIETRLALPVRSPTPFMVPWTWRAPASMAASELATPTSASLWQWIATRASGPTAVTTAAVASATCPGSEEPLVSHRATVSAPAPAAARRQASA